MSRVGRAPIAIPDKTSVEISGQHVAVKGPKGELSREIHPEITARVDNGSVLVERPSDQKKHRALHGLTRALIQNMVTGCSEGYVRELDIIGVGYRAEMKGKIINLLLGYSHPIYVAPPDGVTIDYAPKENRIKVSGTDKELVGMTAAKIRSLRPPEPYKGKGVRYVGEQVRTKAGKAASK